MGRDVGTNRADRHIDGAHNVAHGRTRGDHREDVLVVGNGHVKQIGLSARKHLVERGINLFGALDALAGPAVGIGELDEIGVRIEDCGAEALAIEELLPLMNHAESAVVEDKHLHRNIVDGCGGHFLAVHLERTVAGNADNLRVGAPEGSTDGSREAESHGAQATGGNERARTLAVDELRRPHLMLADLGDDDGMGGIELDGEVLQHPLGNDGSGLFGKLSVIEREATTPFPDLLEPLVGCGLHAGLFRRVRDAGEHAFQVADDRHLNLADLADLGRIDVDMDDLGVRREFGKLARHAIGEARTASDDQVGFGHGEVGVLGAVHAHEAEVQRAGRRESALAHERGDNGQLKHFGKTNEFVRCAGGHDTAANVEHRTLSALDARHRRANLLGVAAIRGTI